MIRDLDLLTEADCRAFIAAIVQQGELFYQYMHGERHEPDEAMTVLKRHLQFFEGDWIGLIDFDLELRRWSTNIFYNIRTESSTETLIAEAETFEQVARWIHAAQTFEPIIIENIEDIKEDAPDEYELYTRLEVTSILAVPYRNSNSGFLVVKNPRKYKDFYEVLNIMAYIVTNELIAKKRRDNLLRHTSNEIQLADNQIKINMFGEMEIQGKDFVIKSEDIPSEIMRRLIVFLALNKGRAFNTSVLNDKLMTDKSASAWKNLIYKFRKVWKNASCKDEDVFQLITFNGVGYQLNTDLEIITDLEQANVLMRAIDDASSEQAKEEMLKRFYALYRGEFMSQEDIDDLFIRDYRLHYKNRFIDKMAELIVLLFNKGDFVSAERYSSAVLKLYPDSIDLHVLYIISLKKIGKMKYAKEAFEGAIRMLEPEEVELFKERLAKAEATFIKGKRIRYLVKNGNLREED